MSTTDTRAAFEAQEKHNSSNLKRDDTGQYENPCTQSAWEGWQAALAWQAATEAAKATGTAGELFGYGSSEKKNCLLSKAQYDSCAPKNRSAYGIPLYAYSLPKCENCEGYGVITHISGQTPDNYEECNEVCPDCEGEGAARQPAPVVAAEIDKDALRTEVQLRGHIHQLNDEIERLRAIIEDQSNRSQP